MIYMIILINLVNPVKLSFRCKAFYLSKHATNTKLSCNHIVSARPA